MYSTTSTGIIQPVRTQKGTHTLVYTLPQHLAGRSQRQGGQGLSFIPMISHSTVPSHVLSDGSAAKAAGVSDGLGALCGLQADTRGSMMKKKAPGSSARSIMAG